MNFARDVVDAADPSARALVELARDGTRRAWRFGEIADGAARLAGTLRAHGVGRGDVVMTIVGNRPEWVLTMVACFRIGAVVLPCTEQLRAKDLRMRLDVVGPRLVVCDVRDRAVLEEALALPAGGAPAEPGPLRRASPADPAEPTATHPAPTAGAAAPAPPTVLLVPGADLLAGDPAPAVELEPTDPCLITFTSGTSGAPKAVLHGQRYLTGQGVQAEHWLAPEPGELVWCTAASGWSKSARNAFIAPWIRGAAALLHDARFDPAERLAIVARERVAVLCMAPTEYRVIAARATLGPLPDLRGMVAAGEALNPEVLRAFEAATGLPIRDGYGQTETGQITGVPPGGDVRPGSMGRPLPGVRAWVDAGELVVDPTTVPTHFLRYLGDDPTADAAGAGSPWRTGDRVAQDDDGFLFFEGRTDDVIISAGYRIGPFEVESALVAHEAVAEAAVVAAPDAERGSVVRAVVVLRPGHEPSADLAAALQAHVRAQTAPYKYPRRVDFADALPKTTSGKVRRAALREEG